jgi:hypothetical protein
VTAEKADKRRLYRDIGRRQSSLSAHDANLRYARRGAVYSRLKKIHRMEPPDDPLTLTKIQGATRQIDAAIVAFVRGDFDIAITLAGAAEGMIERDGLHMFAFLRDSPRVQDVEKADWISTLNLELYWLKHPSGPDTLQIERAHAAYMIARAASKLEKWTPQMEDFKVWLCKNVDRL